MKGHKAEHHKGHKAEGGEIRKGTKEYEEDLRMVPRHYNEGGPEGEAEERKHGGRAKRKHGGHVHHEDMSKLKHAKHVGPVHGERAKPHAGRKMRKAGGRAGADKNPFSSAHAGMLPAHQKDAKID